MNNCEFRVEMSWLPGIPTMRKQRIVRVQRTTKRVRKVDPISDILGHVQDQTFLIPAVVCFLLAYSHVQDPVTGFLGRLVTRLGENTHTEGIAKFLKSHVTQLVGFLCYSAAIISAAPPTRKVSLIGIAAVAAFVLPEVNAFEYAGQ